MDATPSSPSSAAPRPSTRELQVWRALALALAALVAVLVFSAYSQPELLLNYTGLRYCG